MIETLLSQILGGNVQRQMAEHGTLIYAYHSVSKAPIGSQDPFLHVSPKRFEQDLEKLRSVGFRSTTLDQVAACAPTNSVVITFDDGRRDVWQNAMEPLARHGFQAMQFLVAGLLGKENKWDTANGDAAVPLMDVSEVREWLAAGHSIGSHTMTHVNLAEVPLPEAREQIFASKKCLEDTFGVAVNHFAYPHGKMTPAVRELVREAGYTTACGTLHGPSSSSTNLFALNRLTPLSAPELVAKAAHRAQRKVRHHLNASLSPLRRIWSAGASTAPAPASPARA